ncbi:hypothetical protein PENTCL1PPCAC_1590 [Pristionchus entomophagus]|uniref:Small ribosomal subunit protein mS35 mitochondrial conserved domain-containing protein n=1 Tax=Pristionchus entomophagus TaxID=358040 RepID=A0AAV5S9Q8_9BILA|nr:hypothetical protein PENTCL1PPCAC_1590 [Pristionchus entomophagus]
MMSRRNYSSLASKLREAVSSEGGRIGGVASSIKDTVDARGESFHEMFVMPKRKLQAQIQLERISGRAQEITRPRMDIHDRLAVRKPRADEMETNQDWSSVWPAARSFASSVVPLPIRMGSRKNPDKRAPFKKEGNLELVKIPNFLHLTPAAIQKHCEAIRKFTTPFPSSLAGQKDIAALPLTMTYADYVHQGTNIRDNRARVTTIRVKCAALGLNPAAKEKLQRLAGDRYEEETDTITITTDRCHTRAQNYDYAFYLLTVVYHEANKVESWEEMKAEQDRLKLVFEGSLCQERLKKAVLATGLSEEEVAERLQKFGQVWTNYVNKEETEESTRQYAAAMKGLLARKAEHRV